MLLLMNEQNERRPDVLQQAIGQAKMEVAKEINQRFADLTQSAATHIAMLQAQIQDLKREVGVLGNLLLQADESIQKLASQRLASPLGSFYATDRGVEVGSAIIAVDKIVLGTARGRLVSWRAAPPMILAIKAIMEGGSADLVGALMKRYNLDEADVEDLRDINRKSAAANELALWVRRQPKSHDLEDVNVALGNIPSATPERVQELILPMVGM